MLHPLVDVFDPTGRLPADAFATWARPREHGTSASLAGRLSAESLPCVALIAEPESDDRELPAALEAAILHGPHLVLVVCRTEERASIWRERGAIDAVVDSTPGPLSEPSARGVEGRIRRLVGIRARLERHLAGDSGPTTSDAKTAAELVDPAAEIAQDLQLLLEEPSLPVRIREDMAQVRRKAQGLLADVRRWRDRLAVDRGDAPADDSRGGPDNTPPPDGMHER